MSEAAATIVRAGEGRVVHVAGDAYTIKLAGAQSGGGLAVFEFEVPPGGGPPPHVHGREDESFYIVTGEITFYVEGGELTARAGDFVFARRGHMHRFRNNSASTGRMLCWVNPAGLEEYFCKVGRVFDSATQAPRPQPPTEDEIHRLVSEASNYGLTILPPH